MTTAVCLRTNIDVPIINQNKLFKLGVRIKAEIMVYGSVGYKAIKMALYVRIKTDKRIKRIKIIPENFPQSYLEKGNFLFRLME